jgi:RNase P subunit RPR2
MVKDKKQIIEKINFLIDFAISQKNEKNPYIYNYIKICFDLAKKINYRFPSSFHRRICKNCLSIRTIENTKIRVFTIKKNKVKKKQIKLHCLSCNHIKKISVNNKNTKKATNFLLKKPI